MATGSASSRIVNGCYLCGKALKWIPVLFIITVLVWSYYAYIVQLCFMTSINVGQQICYFIVYHGILVMLAWSYWQTIFTPVGEVPKHFAVSSRDLERLEQAESQEVQKQMFEQLAKNLPVVTRTPLGVRYCEKCAHLKPDRCHHCSVCGVCVLKMDHHCPWVNNCVGFTNYKFFLLFLGYGFTYCIFISLTSLPFFIKFWENELQAPGKFHILFLFFVATMFAISLVSLWGYHIYLVLHNRSTLEAFRPPLFLTGPDKDGFNLGRTNNFIEVFGDTKILWFLPVSTSFGDGVSFPTRHLTGCIDDGALEVPGLNPTSTNLNQPGPDPVSSTEPSSQRQGHAIVDLGDGVSFPQRHADDDQHTLLSNAQHWPHDQDDPCQDEHQRLRSPSPSSYHIVNVEPLVQV